jgi:tetratricopeptide (TPR) repeat protein
MKNILLHIILLIAVSSAQGQNSVSEAFSKSYELEYNQEYTKAITTISTVYDATSYAINLRMGWLSYLNADYLKSKTYYKNAINLNPRSIEARLGIANPLSVLQNWEDIIVVYKEILQISENQVLANYRLAYIYYNKKKFDTANEYATKVASLYPFDFDNNLLLGKINISLGNITIAKKYLNMALLYNPTSTEVIGLLKVL